MSWAKAAQIAYKIYQGAKLAIAVIDMGTTLYEIFLTADIMVRKKMLQNLWDKHKDEFETMKNSGELMEKIIGMTSLNNEIEKAKIASTQNWTTIALQLDRNTNFLMKLSTNFKDRRKGIQQSTTIGVKGWLSFGLMVGGAGISAYMLKKNAPKTWGKLWAPNPYTTKDAATAGKLKLKNVFNKIKALKSRGYKFNNIDDVVAAQNGWKNRVYTGLKWTGKMLLRGFQVLKIVMSIWSIIQGHKAIDDLKEQHQKLEKYYKGEDPQTSFANDIKGVIQALTNVAFDLDYLHFASMAVIIDFNKIFSLQYALAASKPEAFRTLAEEYDPEKLGFSHAACEEIKQNAQKMGSIYSNQNLEEKTKMNDLYKTLKAFLEKSNPKDRIMRFTAKLSKDISRFIEHEEIWKEHDKFVTFHEQTLKVWDNYQNNQKIDNEKEISDIGEQIQKKVKNKLTGEDSNEYFDLLKQNSIDPSKKLRKRQLRKKADISEDEEDSLVVYLMKEKKKYRDSDILKDVTAKYCTIFSVKEPNKEDRDIIARQLINLVKETFFATDTTGKTIHGLIIADYKSKETYKDFFQRQDSRTNLIPIKINNQNQQSNWKQFMNIYDTEVPAKIKEKVAKPQMNMRFLRIYYEYQVEGNKDSALVFKTSSGWRVKLTFKDSQSDFYYLEKDRTKPNWEFRPEKEVVTEETKVEQKEDNTSETTEETKE